MDKVIIVAAITAGAAIFGPISLALMNDWLAIRKENREAARAAKLEEQRITRERATKNAVYAQSAATKALEAHLAEVTEDRNWWRDRALYLERQIMGGSVKWRSQ